MKPPVSVASKGLTGSLNCLESTLTKNRGEGGVLWLTNSLHALACKKCICKSLVFYALRTLPSSVACKSFACHSYKNCRVYTNNSHSETQRPRERALALTREAKQHTFRHRWNPSPSADEKPITCRGHRCWNDCDCGIAAGERANGGAAGSGNGAAALAGDRSHRGECHVPAVAHRLDFGGFAGRRGTGARRAFRRAEAAIPWHDFSAAHQSDYRAAALRDARGGHRRACGLEESRAAGHQVARLFRNCFHDRAADRICGDQFEPRGRRRTAAAIHGGGNAERDAAHGDATHHGYFSGEHREVCRRRPGTASRGLQYFVCDGAGAGAGSEAPADAGFRREPVGDDVQVHELGDARGADRRFWRDCVHRRTPGTGSIASAPET